MTQPHKYRIILNKEPEGGYTVIVPSLPGCVTYGKDFKEARGMATEAIEGFIELLTEQDEPISADTNTLESFVTIISGTKPEYLSRNHRAMLANNNMDKI